MARAADLRAVIVTHDGLNWHAGSTSARRTGLASGRVSGWSVLDGPGRGWTSAALGAKRRSRVWFLTGVDGGTLHAPKMPEFIFTMQGVTKVHPPDKRVLENIHLAFYPGAKIGVIGANGSGKSSLFMTISGLRRPTRGRIAFEDRELAGRSTSHIAAAGIVLFKRGKWKTQKI